MADAPLPTPNPAPSTPAPEVRKVAVVGEIPFAGMAVSKALIGRGIGARILWPDGSLEDGLQQWAAKRKNPGPIEWVKGDLGSTDAVATVVGGSYGACFATPITMAGRRYRPGTHLDDLKRLIEASEKGAIRKLIYHSSLAQNPLSPAKALQEAAVAETLVDASRCEDFALRTGPLMGNDDGFLTEISARAKASSPVLAMMGYGSTLLQPLYVDDFAQCVVRVFEDRPDEVQPGQYNLGGPEVVEFMNVMDLALERAQRSKLKLHAPLSIVRLIASFQKNGPLMERFGMLSDAICGERNDASTLLIPPGQMTTAKEALNALSV